MRLLHVLLLLTFLVLVSGYFSDNGDKKVKKIKIVHYDSTSSSSSEEHRHRPRGGKGPRFDDGSFEDYSGRRGGGRHRPPRPPRPPRPVPTPKPVENMETLNGPFGPDVRYPIPGGYWDTGKVLRFYGVPGQGRWSINLDQAKTWLFHFASQPDLGHVVRTREQNGQFQTPDTYGGNPFPAGANFNVTMVNQPTHIEIHVNQVFFTNYNHRTGNPSRDYQHVVFSGNVIISKIEITR
ncbi:Galectin [Caenorhabditis elegans]|uniref:Galectin n=1 Tax=Caenorhabditis elegans TaxID=6239 RepID=C4RVF6_CAEEL|nr:Galectin [Caenorhabditis elegans]CAB63201.2 Galectin [Caenorhabditis elegans]|eukprot:NP_492881.2 Galectin [Caenorhabditis elegans]